MNQTLFKRIESSIDFYNPFEEIRTSNVQDTKGPVNSSGDTNADATTNK